MTNILAILSIYCRHGSIKYVGKVAPGGQGNHGWGVFPETPLGEGEGRFLLLPSKMAVKILEHNEPIGTVALCAESRMQVGP